MKRLILLIGMASAEASETPLVGVKFLIECSENYGGFFKPDDVAECQRAVRMCRIGTGPWGAEKATCVGYARAELGFRKLTPQQLFYYDLEPQNDTYLPEPKKRKHGDL